MGTWFTTSLQPESTLVWCILILDDYLDRSETFSPGRMDFSDGLSNWYALSEHAGICSSCKDVRLCVLSHVMNAELPHGRIRSGRETRKSFPRTLSCKIHGACSPASSADSISFGSSRPDIAVIKPQVRRYPSLHSPSLPHPSLCASGIVSLDLVASRSSEPLSVD